MKLGSCKSVRYTYEVATKYEPEIGNSYKDVSGEKWYVESVRVPHPCLRDPIPDNLTLWEVVFRAEYAPSKISKVLFPIYECIHSIGYLERKMTLAGFGRFEHEGKKYSWIFRFFPNTEKYELCVGDDVTNYNAFTVVKYKFEADYIDDYEQLPWDIVIDCLNKFKELLSHSQ